MQLLFQHGADIHASDDVAFRNEAALRKASKNGHADVVQLLLQHGAMWADGISDADDAHEDEEDDGVDEED